MLTGAAKEEIDFASWASYFAFDAMGDLGFGSDFQMLATGQYIRFSVSSRMCDDNDESKFQVNRTCTASSFIKLYRCG